jgi:hypothetical protein
MCRSLNSALGSGGSGEVRCIDKRKPAKQEKTHRGLAGDQIRRYPFMKAIYTTFIL